MSIEFLRYECTYLIFINSTSILDFVRYQIGKNKTKDVFQSFSLGLFWDFPLFFLLGFVRAKQQLNSPFWVEKPSCTCGYLSKSLLFARVKLFCPPEGTVTVLSVKLYSGTRTFNKQQETSLIAIGTEWEVWKITEIIHQLGIFDFWHLRH